MGYRDTKIPCLIFFSALWYTTLQTYGPEQHIIMALAFMVHVGSRTAQTHKSKFAPVSNSVNDSEPQNLEQSWILLAESQQSMRNKIGKYLAKEGQYTVTGVADAKSVLLICRGLVQPKKIPKMNNSTQPDCLVIDSHLPDPINGLDLLKIIRSDPMLNLLPVILLGERGRSDGLDAGADAYLSKPFDLEELLSVIDGTLKRCRPPPSRRTESSNDKLSMLRADELWREISEIKSLLVKAGFNMTDSYNSTSYDASNGSIEQDIAEMKLSLIGAKEDSGDMFVAEENTHHKILLPDEVKIIHLLDQGMTNKEVASTIDLPINDITAKLNVMIKKAAVKNKTELIKWWRNQTVNIE